MTTDWRQRSTRDDGRLPKAWKPWKPWNSARNRDDSQGSGWSCCSNRNGPGLPVFDTDCCRDEPPQPSKPTAEPRAREVAQGSVPPFTEFGALCNNLAAPKPLGLGRQKSPGCTQAWTRRRNGFRGFAEPKSRLGANHPPTQYSIVESSDRGRPPPDSRSPVVRRQESPPRAAARRGEANPNRAPFEEKIPVILLVAATVMVPGAHLEQRRCRVLSNL